MPGILVLTVWKLPFSSALVLVTVKPFFNNKIQYTGSWNYKTCAVGHTAKGTGPTADGTGYVSDGTSQTSNGTRHVC